MARQAAIECLTPSVRAELMALQDQLAARIDRRERGR
jgi:hypothetical protein